MLSEYDKVETSVDKPGFPKGAKGIIVGFYSDDLAYEVELWDETGYPTDVVTYELDEVRKINS